MMLWKTFAGTITVKEFHAKTQRKTAQRRKGKRSAINNDFIAPAPRETNQNQHNRNHSFA